MPVDAAALPGIEELTDLPALHPGAAAQIEDLIPWLRVQGLEHGAIELVLAVEEAQRFEQIIDRCGVIEGAASGRD